MCSVTEAYETVWKILWKLINIAFFPQYLSLKCEIQTITEVRTLTTSSQILETWSLESVIFNWTFFNFTESYFSHLSIVSEVVYLRYYLNIYVFDRGYVVVCNEKSLNKNLEIATANSAKQRKLSKSEKNLDPYAILILLNICTPL